MYIITYACDRIHGQGARVTQGAPGSSRQNSIIPIVTFLHAYPLELLLPHPVRLSGQNFFEQKFSPFQWTGRWKFATNGGSSQHFYRRLNASKSARIESREDSKTLTVAEIGKNGVFFVKRARCNPRFSHFGCPSTLRGLEHPEIFSRVRSF